MYYELQARINFLDLLREVDPDSDDYEKIEQQIQVLKYVESVWIDHNCIIKAHLMTANAKIAERRLRDLMGKVERIVKKYAPKK